VKVLDFGLAKVQAAAASSTDNSPTLSMTATNAAVIMGTAAYMSPEQARGKPVDKRADIWAFGVVLYEMLTGRRLFKGEDVSEILAAVIKEEPDFEQVPASMDRLLRLCLERAPSGAFMTLPTPGYCSKMERRHRLFPSRPAVATFTLDHRDDSVISDCRSGPAVRARALAREAAGSSAGPLPDSDAG
jgi:serine/threonine protein kinase